MNKCGAFKIFIYKILKEYQFSWIFKLCFLVLIPISLILANLKIYHGAIVNEEIIFDALDKVSKDTTRMTT